MAELLFIALRREEVLLVRAALQKLEQTERVRHILERLERRTF